MAFSSESCWKGSQAWGRTQWNWWEFVCGLNFTSHSRGLARWKSRLAHCRSCTSSGPGFAFAIAQTPGQRGESHLHNLMLVASSRHSWVASTAWPGHGRLGRQTFSNVMIPLGVALSQEGHFLPRAFHLVSSCSLSSLDLRRPHLANLLSQGGKRETKLQFEKERK